MVEAAKRHLDLTEEQCAEMVPSGTKSRVEDRTRWAMYHLRKAGLLESQSRGLFQITDKGMQLLASQVGDITNKQIDDMQRVERLQPEEDTRPGGEGDSLRTDTPDEQMGKSYQVMMTRLEEDILDSVKNVSPKSFEGLVNQLLGKMGYGEIEKEAGHSGDQGIDGILNQDKLGLEKVYVQAKRYTAGQVGEPEIRNFSGSLVAMGARKGVFITTSTFSSTANETAKSVSMGNQFIRLIGGRELAQLMIEHGVGVVIETTYEVKKLDANYFAEL